MGYRDERFWGHEWGDLPIIFMSNGLTSENHWKIASRVTPKSLFNAIWCPEHIIPLKQLSIADFGIVAKDSLFLFSIMTSPQLICDVTRMLDIGIVMSYSSIVLARANGRKGDLR